MLGSNEIVVDNFAGGGGASTALDQALGRDPHEAVNHDPIAIAMHKANHPRTRHWCQNIWRVNPCDVAERRPIGVAWFSPDCTHHSKAKGGKPIGNGRRDLAWVVAAWGRTVAPRIMFLENVEEFADWGPVVDGRPCPDRKGHTFKRFVRELRRQGYAVEWDELRACDYGAPTTRKRLFMVARRDGAPIKWPDRTHARMGESGLLPWRSAAEIIDWNLMCPSIFLSREQAREIGCKRPLADKTMARIAAGVKRYVLDAAEPFIVPITHAGSIRTNGTGEPLRTVTTAHRGEFSLLAPYFVPRYGERDGQEPRARRADGPLPTIVPDANGASLVAAHITRQFGASVGSAAGEPVGTITPGGGGKAGIVAAFLAQHNTDMVGHHAREPVSTIVQKGCTQAVVAAHLLNLKGSNRRDRAAGEPIFTQCSGGNHIAEVRAFLIKYHGSGTQWQDARSPLLTADSHGRFGLVLLNGALWQLADIGMRMLTPRELFCAQGFPDDYKIDPLYLGKPLTKTAQIQNCGNSVSPPPAIALIRANVLQAPRMRRRPQTPIEARIAA